MSAPLNYDEAAAAAAAIHAAKAGQDPVAVLAAMAEQTIGARDNASQWAKNAIRQLWATVNPYSDAQVQAFAQQAAALMQSAQTGGARTAAAAQQHQLAAVGVTVSAAPSNPVNVRAPSAVIKAGQLVLLAGAVSVNYAGPGADRKVTAADMSTAGIFLRPAAVFRYAATQPGIDPAQAAAERIDSLVDDNLMLAQRLAAQQVIVQAVDLDSGNTRNGRKAGPRIVGYRRVIHPERSRGGTCGLCIAAADRIYHVAQLMPIHDGCKCTVAAVTEDYDPADDLNAVDLSQLYKHAGGTSAPHLKRTRYQVDQHGELGPVLVPAKTYKPRTAASKRRAGATALQTEQPSPKEFAKHQIGVLETNLAKMRAEGVPEDSPKIAYHEQMIAKFRKQLLDEQAS